MSVNRNFVCVLVLSVVFMMTTNLCALDGGYFRLQGIVVDATNGQPIPGVAIVCKRTGDGVISNKEGHFALNTLWSDSLYLSAVAYKNYTIKPPDSLFLKKEAFIKLEMQPTKYELEEVSVYGEEQVPLALRSKVFKEKPKVGDFIFRPLSSIFYYLSKSERRKRTMVNIIRQDQLLARYAHIYNRETIAEYSGLTDSRLDSCIMYCNVNIALQNGDTDEVVRWKILRVISDYYRRK